MSIAKRCGLLCLAVMMLLLAASPGAHIRAQDADDDPQIETTRTTRTQPEDEEPAPDPTAVSEPDVEGEDDPAVGNGDEDVPDDRDEDDIDAADSGDTGGSPNVAAIDVDDAWMTIAQGLAAFDSFEDGVYRITAMEPREQSEAPSVTAPYYGFLYQMDGTTIVRNDATGKRARLEPGEAYYFSAGDPYTRYREDGPSRAWLIEIVPEDADPADAAGTVIYTSDTIDGFPDDTRDFELISDILLEDAEAEFPDYDVDLLVMVTVGELEISHDGDTKRLVAPAAFQVSERFTLTNEENDPAVYIVARVGPSVGEFSGGGGTVPADDADQVEDAAADPMLDSDGDTLIDTDEVAYGTDPELADSDGDGYSDGDEVLIYGTDPLDPGSWP
ncbi:MAG: thrombospondin type 3 repeat-containing protein [Chloroflexota bacterium]|nr:thrombospondin type 3 repeat-containing protein [Chloroflexota bacterium]